MTCVTVDSSFDMSVSLGIVRRIRVAASVLRPVATPGETPNMTFPQALRGSLPPNIKPAPAAHRWADGDVLQEPGAMSTLASLVAVVSISLVPLLEPWVSPVVVAAALPEAGLVLGEQCQA
ncbi:hypothetical protein GCM10009608_76700 [Pseudonocardia alaniniphila]